ncbi:AEC family transporter [Thalassococcus sp. CAU 1522]|uniref:AEC family transporter n=1 Tax=Thalassococcus arenae TaxID=2851652 RepID=A0ABS6N9G4_9RHOB|nr:AEC family transporter [Thalassococcus arenae]MBV2360644.1 AEC family transporter [Thalassococcus arenae]
MFTVLTHNILPVFSMLALGFVLGRLGTISRDEAAAVNRVAFLILQPALILPLIAGLDVAAFELGTLSLYAGSQAVAFVLAFGTARFLLGRETAEAWLLAMAVVFVNTLLYIWPISFLIYGEAAAVPITAIVAWDSSVTFAFFIASTALITGRGSGRRAAALRVVTNPVLVAIAAGAFLNALGLSLPLPLATAMDFAGAAAAPLTLFALGVILSSHRLTPTLPVMTISAYKLVLFPLLVGMSLSVADVTGHWQALFQLAAAGPSGAMAFALALLYGVRTDAIAPVIVWTSLLSLVSLAALA